MSCGLTSDMNRQNGLPSLGSPVLQELDDALAANASSLTTVG